jgi:hypothetical protein
MKGYRRVSLGWLSLDGEVYLDRGAPAEGGYAARGCYCWMLNFRARPDEYEVGPDYGNGPTAWAKLTSDPIRRFSDLTFGGELPGDPWFIHMYDAIGLGDALATVASVMAERRLPDADEG